MRKEKVQEYSVLEAPFYYVQGELLASYVESKIDVMGKIPDLDMEDSEEEQEEEEEDGQEEGGQEETKQEQGVDQAQD